MLLLHMADETKLDYNDYALIVKNFYNIQCVKKIRGQKKSDQGLGI